MNTRDVSEIFASAYFDVKEISDGVFSVVERGARFRVFDEEAEYIQFSAIYETGLDFSQVIFVANHVNCSLMDVRAYEAHGVLHLDHVLSLNPEVTNKQIVLGFKRFSSAALAAVQLVDQVGNKE